ncbi:pimeloyl-ACP methyl ester carboxylesterase [Peribacillus deserti]|uniref:Pimeloyl-ACP methyl ester carboxylesterase n=1 Tax=Peribacillus deserti TaxID=673318 RepID=A0ABS2QGR9_9BACI|nr:alpha/beta hydrolase [Peribacillus deserti]MBM7692024.1 pimeloyl-ACP methyl ester carboxylesterase [Peribacillus deserti]
MEKKQTIINHKKVFYLEEGDPGSPAVLLLHGVPESSLVWEEIVPAILSSGCRAIAPDLPGFGQSEPFDEASTWERFGEFVSDFKKHLHLEKVHLVVHDWGGLIGLKWACDHPEDVLSIVVSNSTISDEYSWHKLAQIWRTPGIGEEAMKKFADWGQFSSETRKSIPGITEKTLKDFYQVFHTEDSSKVVLDLYRSGNLQTVKMYQEKLKSLKVPVSILWGENDPYVPLPFAWKLKNESFPHAQVSVIQDAGHFIQIEVPHAVNKLMIQHLNQYKK